MRARRLYNKGWPMFKSRDFTKFNLNIPWISPGAVLEAPEKQGILRESPDCRAHEPLHPPTLDPLAQLPREAASATGAYPPLLPLSIISTLCQQYKTFQLQLPAQSLLQCMPCCYIALEATPCNTQLGSGGRGGWSLLGYLGYLQCQN